MKRIVCLVLVAIGCIATISPSRAEQADDVKQVFVNPPREYASAPLWVWNDLLTEEQIAGTLEDLARQKVKQAFVHPRPGLMTPYLSDDWFRLWKVALREAERLDMNIWIYDENSYPSGFAGGLVPDAMPESRGRGLATREVPRPENLGSEVAAVFRMTGDGYEQVTGAARAGQSLPEGKYMVFSWIEAPAGGWFAGKWYVDLLKPGVTEKFIEVTLEPYRREIGQEFGGRCPGVFTDEPHLTPAGGIHWNEHLAEESQKRWGYNIADHLPALLRPTGDWRRVRHNYHQLLLEQFIEHWAKPCYEYCEQHNLEFTGHYWEHGWPGTSHGPDNMAMYAWHQRPAIDCLMNQYDEGVNAQFGNARFVRELASVANQMGRQRTLCEAYGAGGWDLRFEDMKRIGDWLYVLGVNTMDEHLSYITLRGARKRDHPQSFSYHEPWWEDYHVMAEYFTRLSAAISSGKQVNRIMVLEPTTSAWLYQPDPGHKQQLGQLGNEFQDLVNRLEAAQVEYDLGCEQIMGDHGSVGGKWLRVGQAEYHTVVLPPGTDGLNDRTAKLIEDFATAGGRVICCGDPPSLVDGQPSDRLQKAADQAGWARLETAKLPETLLSLSDDGFAIRRDEGDSGKLFHQRRRLDDGELLFLVNTSIEAPSTGSFVAKAASIEQWDPQTGAASPYDCTSKDGTVEARYSLPPCGSLLVLLSGKPASAAAAAPAAADAVTLKPDGQMQIHRLGPNVLTLDYVDITAGGETRKNVYFYVANQMAFQKNGMPRNPWDSEVQFRDELIRKTFPPESGFEMSYRFTVEGNVPERLSIVIERPDLYSITCNGQPVQASAGDWWLDRAFIQIPIAKQAKAGENVVTLKAQPFSIMHEIEPAYVTGGSRLRATDAGFVLTADEPLELGNWNEQGQPFYAEGVAYTQTFSTTKKSGRYEVSLPAWYGSVARVSVNGQPARRVAYQPWTCDVTDAIQAGKNTIEVVIVGTLKNTLGPHHGNPRLGAAWPHAFRVAPEGGPPPGGGYHTVGYGLLEPFVLTNRPE